MVLGALPGWLVAGVALGAVAAMGALIVFAVGTRRYGTPPTGGVSDPHAPRRAEVRAYLVGLGEVFTERETIAGHAVDFWLPHRGVAVTFDASAYLALSSSGYRAVLLEHELPGDRIGPRLPFDTPSPTADDDRSEVTRWAYARLGLEVGADREAVERAYRERVLETHPDRGGDPTELQAVLQAYDRLTRGSPRR